ncbi:MAG: hypothetical protein ACOC0M_06650 [Halomonas sp.]
MAALAWQWLPSPYKPRANDEKPSFFQRDIANDEISSRLRSRIPAAGISQNIEIKHLLLNISDMARVSLSIPVNGQSATPSHQCGA